MWYRVLPQIGFYESNLALARVRPFLDSMFCFLASGSVIFTIFLFLSRTRESGLAASHVWAWFKKRLNMNSSLELIMMDNNRSARLKRWKFLTSGSDYSNPRKNKTWSVRETWMCSSRFSRPVCTMSRKQTQFLPRDGLVHRGTPPGRRCSSFARPLAHFWSSRGSQANTAKIFWSFLSVLSERLRIRVAGVWGMCYTVATCHFFSRIAYLIACPSRERSG